MMHSLEATRKIWLMVVDLLNWNDQGGNMRGMEERHQRVNVIEEEMLESNRVSRAREVVLLVLYTVFPLLVFPTTFLFG